MGKAKATYSATIERVAITEKALIQRINRTLADGGETLKKSRPGTRMEADCGDFYILDVSSNSVIGKRVDLEDLGRQIGALKPFEDLSND